LSVLADTDFADTDFADTDFADTDFADTDFADTDFAVYCIARMLAGQSLWRTRRAVNDAALDKVCYFMHDEL
jgi:hypothetical protein